MKKFWNMTAKAAGELEILIFEEIGESYWSGEGLSAKKFAEDLKAAGRVSRILLRVSSPGGNVMDGLAIYEALLNHGAKIVGRIEGLCASIAGVIICAASEIEIGASSLFMAHNPAALLVAGDSKEMRKMADTLDVVKSSMIRAYKRQTWKSESEISDLMDRETWYSGQEAVDAGFATRVVNSDDESDDEELAAAVRSPIFARFRRVPARVSQIAARYAGASGGDQYRRRRDRQRTIELQEMDLRTMAAAEDQRRRRRLREIEADYAAIMARPYFSEDYLRRLTMAARDKEIHRMRMAELEELGRGDANEGRRRRVTEYGREVAAMNPPVVKFQGMSSGAGGRF